MKNFVSFLKPPFAVFGFKLVFSRKNLFSLLFCLYRVSLSPHLGGACRFKPSCSVYAWRVFSRFSFFRALTRVVKRLLCCHGFYPLPGLNPPFPPGKTKRVSRYEILL